MPFGDRLTLIGKALVGLFSADSAAQAHGLLAGIFPGASGPPPTKGARERIAAYADMPWLHAVAGKVADAFAATRWRLLVVRRPGAARAVKLAEIQRAPLGERQALLAARKQAGELTEVTDHPLLGLLDGGNPYMTGLALRRLTALHWDLEGEAFWLKERNGLRTPVGAWPIPPHWVTATPTPTNPAYRVSFRGWQGMIPDTEMLWLPNHNPENPYGRGSGFARALADELETDEYAAKHMRQTFFNQARPDFLVFPKAPATWTEPERIRLQHDWEAQHQGFWRAFKARFSSRELGIHEFGVHDFRHLQMVQLRQFERDLIVQVFGVPPEIMGILENANRATIEAADFLFARWVLVPRLEAFRAILQERLVPEYDDRLILDYVSPIKEDREYQLKVAQVAPWSRTVDEWRGLQDLAPLDDGRGHIFYVPVMLTPTTLDGEQDLAQMSAAELLRIRRSLTRDGSPGAPSGPGRLARRARFIRDARGLLVGVETDGVEAHDGE